jgi:hypothetical protein
VFLLYTSSLDLHLPQNYLGHSINAPTGRWQKNKDVHWYNRDANTTSDERAEEIRKIKEAEAEALSVALYERPMISFPSPRIFIGIVQWVWAIQEGIIVKYTSHGRQFNPYSFLNRHQCACKSR